MLLGCSLLPKVGREWRVGCNWGVGFLGLGDDNQAVADGRIAT